MTSWKDYQLQAAQFFRSLELTSTVEETVVGVRGSHDIDVYVQGNVMGIPFSWVVECKHWKTNVPKEKVAALTSIIQDVGADRGFLLSETGFQSGALRMAEKSNVTLTSLADLATIVGDRPINIQVASLRLRIHNVMTKLRDIRRSQYSDQYYPPTMKPLGRLHLLSGVIDEALAGEFPIPYTYFGPDQKFVHSVSEMLVAVDEIITEAEEWTPPD